MDRIERTQIQVRMLLKNYHAMFSNVKTKEELVEVFRSLFSSPKEYWTHVRKHAVPEHIQESLRLNDWISTMKHSGNISEYQLFYAMEFLSILGKPERIALVVSPNTTIDRIVFYAFSDRQHKIAVVLENGGKVVSIHALDKFRSWEHWKEKRLFLGEQILEVPIDDEIKKWSRFIQEFRRKLAERFRPKR